MTDYNSVVICGKITRDLDSKSVAVTGSGKTKLSFSVAVNRSQKDGDEWKTVASFFDIVVWDKAADIARNYIQKGRGVVVFGSLRQDKWTKQDGSSVSKIYILAESLKFEPLKDSGKTEGLKPVQNVDLDNSNGGFPEDVPF